MGKEASVGGINPRSVVYWFRFFLGIAAGIANDVIGIGDLFNAIVLGLAFYLLSIIVVRYMLHYGESELKGKNREITLGGGTFIVVWIMVAVLFHTIGGA